MNRILSLLVIASVCMNVSAVSFADVRAKVTKKTTEVRTQVSDKASKALTLVKASPANTYSFLKDHKKAVALTALGVGVAGAVAYALYELLVQDELDNVEQAA